MQSQGQGWAEGSWCRGREEAARIEAPVCIPRLALETPDRREADVVSLTHVTHTLIHKSSDWSHRTPGGGTED